MAKGGMITAFCEGTTTHNPECEYFAHGGEVSEIDIKQILNPQCDHKGDVAAALLHCGAYHLLTTHMHGAFADPSSGMHKIANEEMQVKLARHMAAGGEIEALHPHKLAHPILHRMVSNNQTFGFNNLFSHAKNVDRGHKATKSHMDQLFSEGKAERFEASLEERKKLNEFIESNQLHSQMQDQSLHQAAGPMATNLPEQNIMLHEAKARVSGYLNSLRPQSEPSQYPFDTEREDTEKKRCYEEALDLANKPMSVFNLISSGRLMPQQVKHLNQMYPEVSDFLRQKATEKIVQAQVDKKKLPYSIRQSLSLFLGAPLDSTFLPSSIQAAQHVFAQVGAQSQAAQPKASGRKEKLDQASKSYLTPDQSALSRQQRAR